MTTYTELMMKSINGEALSAIDKEQLRVMFQEMDNNRQVVSAWQNIDKKVNSSFIDFPISVIYSEVFEKNKTFVSVDIPPVYNHLVIRGMGRTNQATGGRIWGQFNGDQASNYKWVGIQGDGSATTANVFSNSTAIFASFGLFATSGTASNYASAFEVVIPHYKSSFYKSAIGFTNEADQNDIYSISSTWLNTAPIQTIRISATNNTDAQDSADMLAGSIISIYGIK